MSLPWVEIEQRVKTDRPQLLERLIGFAYADVLLFWSTDEALQAEQKARWQPILEKLKQYLGLTFKPTTSLSGVENAVENTAALRTYLNGLSDRKLAVLLVTSGAMKSVFLGVALIEKLITADQAADLSELEEIYQNRRWGEDEIALERRGALESVLHEAEDALL